MASTLLFKYLTILIMFYNYEGTFSVVLMALVGGDYKLILEITVPMLMMPFLRVLNLDRHSFSGLKSLDN